MLFFLFLLIFLIARKCFAGVFLTTFIFFVYYDLKVTAIYDLLESVTKPSRIFICLLKSMFFLLCVPSELDFDSEWLNLVGRN